jgi:hypothetical protein
LIGGLLLLLPLLLGVPVYRDPLFPQYILCIPKEVSTATPTTTRNIRGSLKVLFQQLVDDGTEQRMVP